MTPEQAQKKYPEEHRYIMRVIKGSQFNFHPREHREVGMGSLTAVIHKCGKKIHFEEQ